MRVDVGGVITDLGTTETNPTISITDYSRRVTDDFGVTTVVERNFSRRLSVRLGVASDDVDLLQQRLADLRAKSALWIADDDHEWLKVRGFYKDFNVDIAVPPFSYCTLTIEGVAESEVVPDAGGDPAPIGETSTLQLLQPVAITDAALASSVPENDASLWASNTSYATGARVRLTTTHRIYESLISGNLDANPAASPDKWLDVGPTNRWAMFDQALGTVTTANGQITLTLTPGVVSGLALIDVTAATVRVQGSGGYDRTQPVTAATLTFLDLPKSGGAITVTITGPGQVSVGTLLVGNVVSLGITGASPTVGITDYSRKDVDEFGEFTIVERAWSKRMSTGALIRTDAVDIVANRIAAVRARPSLWIGDAGLDSVTIYGFFKEFSIEVGENVSKLALSIEGLSKAAPVAAVADDARRTLTIFRNAEAQPATPPSNSGRVPDGWSASPQDLAGTESRWWSQADFAGDAQLADWTAPVAVAGINAAGQQVIDVVELFLAQQQTDAELVSNGSLSPPEKATIWDMVHFLYRGFLDQLVAQARDLLVDSSDAVAAMNALEAFLLALPDWESTTLSSPVVAVDYLAARDAFFAARNALDTEIKIVQGWAVDPSKLLPARKRAIALAIERMVFNTSTLATAAIPYNLNFEELETRLEDVQAWAIPAELENVDTTTTITPGQYEALARAWEAAYASLNEAVTAIKAGREYDAPLTFVSSSTSLAFAGNRAINLSPSSVHTFRTAIAGARMALAGVFTGGDAILGFSTSSSNLTAQSTILVGFKWIDATGVMQVIEGDTVVTSIPGLTLPIFANLWYAQPGAVDLALSPNGGQAFVRRVVTQTNSIWAKGIVSPGGKLERLYANIEAPVVEGALIGVLSNESHNLPADTAGVVTSYNGATTLFDVIAPGNIPVNAQFTLSVAENPQALVFTLSGNSFAVTGGFDQGEDTATVKLRATGKPASAYPGLTIDRVFSLAKSKAGAGGGSARLFELRADRLVINTDPTGAPTAGQSIRFTTSRTNFTGNSAVTWSVQDANGVVPAPATTYLTIDANTFAATMTAAQWTAARNGTGSVRVTATVTDDGSTLQDVITVQAVANGERGAASKLMLLKADRSAVITTSGGQPTPISQTTNFTIERRNLTTASPAITWAMQTIDGEPRTPISSFLTIAANGLSATMSTAQFTSGRNGTTGVRVFISTVNGGDVLADTETVLQSTNGVDGANKVTVFIRTPNQPVTPTSQTAPPPGWSLLRVPPNGNVEWESSAEFRGGVRIGAWSTPQTAGDSTSFTSPQTFIDSILTRVQTISWQGNAASDPVLTGESYGVATPRRYAGSTDVTLASSWSNPVPATSGTAFTRNTSTGEMRGTGGYASYGYAAPRSTYEGLERQYIMPFVTTITIGSFGNLRSVYSGPNVRLANAPPIRDATDWVKIADIGQFAPSNNLLVDAGLKVYGRISFYCEPDAPVNTSATVDMAYRVRPLGATSWTYTTISSSGGQIRDYYGGPFRFIDTQSFNFYLTVLPYNPQNSTVYEIELVARKTTNAGAAAFIYVQAPVGSVQVVS